MTVACACAPCLLRALTINYIPRCAKCDSTTCGCNRGKK